MPFQHPEEIGYGYVIERYAARKDSGHARYLVLKSGRFLQPEWLHAEHFARHLIDDSATITDVELEALLGYEWRSRHNINLSLIHITQPTRTKEIAYAFLC